MGRCGRGDVKAEKVRWKGGGGAARRHAGELCGFKGTLNM